LIGVPWRIVIGKKLASGMVEMVERKTRQTVDVPVGEAAAVVKQRLG
jgi:prolyl-tRNA synthetase